MPIYSYECKLCNASIKIKHSIKEKLKDCPDCKSSNSLMRLLSNFTIINNQKKAGKIVNSFIEDAKKEIKKEKENFKKRKIEE